MPNFKAEKKFASDKFLYEVRIDKGRSNREWKAFFKNVSSLNAKSPDHGGINGVCILSHHRPVIDVEVLCTEGFTKKDCGLTVTEITAETLSGRGEGGHEIYVDMIKEYFLPFNEYPNIKID